MSVTYNEEGIVAYVDAIGDISFAELHIALCRLDVAESRHIFVDLRRAEIEESASQDIFLSFLRQEMLPDLDHSDGQIVWLIDPQAMHPLIDRIRGLAADCDVLQTATDPKSALALLADRPGRASSDADEILLTDLAVA